MSYRAIYTYAWDLAEAGVAGGAGRVPRTRPRYGDHRRQLSRRQVPEAAWHGGKVYFPEDGTVYFNADASRYGAIKPVANRAARATGRRCAS